MKFRTTLILLTATVGLGAYISLYELRQPAPERRERVSRRILHIDSDTVQEIRLTRPDGALRLTRSNGAWKLTPGGWRAEPRAIRQTLLQTQSLIAKRLLHESEEDPLDLAAFGLTEPDWELTLVTDSGVETLRFGEATPIGKGRYAQLNGGPDVVVLSKELFEWLSQPKEAFRDTRLLRFDRFTLTGIMLETPETTIKLKLEEEQWRLLEPIEGLADWGTVNALVDRLAKLEIERFLENDSEEKHLLKNVQDNPVLKVSVTSGRDSPKVTTVSFGEPLSDDAENILTTRDQEPMLYAISADAIEPLKLSPETLKAQEPTEEKIMK